MILTFKKKQLVNIGGKIAAWIVLFFALFALLSITLKGIIIGSVLIFVSLFILTTYEGTQIDTKFPRHRRISSFFWIKSGQWLKLPEISKISILETTEMIQAGDRYNNSMTAKNKIFILRLHIENSTKMIVVGKFESYSKAKLKMDLLSKELKVMSNGS